MEIITSKEQLLLAKQSNRKDFYTNEYLNNPGNENFKVITNLFFAGDIDRAKELNVGTNLFSTITDSVANFVGEPVIDIDFDITNSVIDLISVGQLVIGLNRNEQGNIEPYYIPAEDFIFTNKEYKVIKQYSEIEGDNIVYYMLKQTYKVGETINELFKLTNANDTAGEKVTLDSIPQTAHLKDIVRTGLDRPAILVTQENSLLEKVKGMVYSLDRKAVMFEKQFLQDVDQYKIFNNLNISAYLDSQNRFDTTKVGKVLVNETGIDGDIKFVSNQNPLIDDAIKYEQTQLRKISSATSVPLDFLGIQDGGAISGISRELLMQSFLKTIEKYREIVEDLLKELLSLMERQKNNEGVEITTNVIWNDILTKSGKEIIDELKIAREAGLISQYTGIKLYLGVDDVQAQEELDLIFNTTINENNGESEV